MNINSAGATLQGEFTGATGTIAESGFLFGTSSTNLSEVEQYKCAGSSSSQGSFTKLVGSLNNNTTYYYQAFVREYNGTTYEYRYGEVKSFTTVAKSVDVSAFLANYEVPSVTPGSSDSGQESSGRGYMWYKAFTSNSNQAIVTHTDTVNNSRVRVYTVMMDASKKAPLWTAHAMHSSMWPDNNVGRSDDWGYDPAFTSSWQQSGVSGYSKGHLVASNYRQTNTRQNKQTFYYSNQAPQIQEGFNGGIWNTLENKVVSITPSGTDTLYVVTGVIYDSGYSSVSGVPIPTRFYKCLMMCSFNSSGVMTSARGCAYLFTNESHSETTVSQLANFKKSISDIEEITGYTYFPRVRSSFSSAITTATQLW